MAKQLKNSNAHLKNFSGNFLTAIFSSAVKVEESSPKPC